MPGEWIELAEDGTRLGTVTTQPERGVQVRSPLFEGDPAPEPVVVSVPGEEQAVPKRRRKAKESGAV